jgi:hypothetical protein
MGSGFYGLAERGDVGDILRASCRQLRGHQVGG